jgi:hypothetical protein
MMPNEIAFFAVTLFLALCTLLIWKRRHDIIHARLNKGLRGYVAQRAERPVVAAEPAAEQPVAPELITA